MKISWVVFVLCLSQTSWSAVERSTALEAKRLTDIEAVRLNGRKVFTDLGDYPQDREIPDVLKNHPFYVPFSAESWVRCQQGNNTMDHENKNGASHGPDKSLRYSLDLNFDNGEQGQPVSASASGTAYSFGGARPIETYADAISEKARDNGGLGNFVAVDHGNGYASIYAHLQSIKVKNGTSVEVGDLLGAMGRTGGSGFASPHLHFYVVPLLKEPEPDENLATQHELFNILYNSTFGWSVPFLLASEQPAVSPRVLDSRLIVSDYYRTNSHPDRPEWEYWHKRSAAAHKGSGTPAFPDPDIF